MPTTASSTLVTASIAEMRTRVASVRARGQRIALVPTMGALHEGHLRLLDTARVHADLVVMSIFVNPLQFGPGEDFARYPRDTEGDLAKAVGRGVDVVFLPAVDAMYPASPRVTVTPVALHERWEGAIRPGHFQGVLTVVAKLLHIVAPDVAVFGQKDIQQVTLVRAMLGDLDFPVELVVAPTVREADGLAMSSRNAFLGAVARSNALALSRALFAIRDAFERGELDAAALERTGRAVLSAAEGVTPDYLALADPATLEPVERVSTGTVAMVAARVGSTRLIDNVILGGG